MNVSENTASSAILLKMIRVSSRVIGGPVADPFEDSDAVESVRDEEAEEPDDGGVSCAAGYGAGWPVGGGVNRYAKAVDSLRIHT